MKKRYYCAAAAFVLVAGMYIGRKVIDSASSSLMLVLVKRTKYIIKAINDRNYEKCHAAFADDLKSSMSLTQMQNTFDPVVSALGSFIRIKSIDVDSRPDSETGLMQCSMKCEYEHGQAQFNILYDSSLHVGGIYIK